jgi:MFS family permease
MVLVCYLIFSFSLAITAYTNSSFADALSGPKMVGILYTLSSVLTVLVLSFAMRVIGLYGNRRFFLITALVQVFSLGVLIAPLPAYAVLCAFVIYLASSNTLLFSMDVFFHHTAAKESRGKARGTYLLIGNLGWMVAPLISAKLVGQFGYAGTYGAALVCIITLIVLVALLLSKADEPTHTPHDLHKPLRTAFKDKTLRRAIAANFLLQFFYTWMVVYTPIYLSLELGISWKTIGLLFSIMLSAFVLLDYPLGRLADFLGSEKELAAIGFIIMGASVAGLAFASGASIVLLGVILFFSRVGAATVEAMTEIHFFKIAQNADPRVLSVFRDLRPVAYIIGPLLGSILLAYYSFRHLFVILCCLMVVGFFLVLGLERKSTWWTRAHRE